MSTIKMWIDQKRAQNFGISSIYEKMSLPYIGRGLTEEKLQHLQNIILPKIKAVLRVAEAKDADVVVLNPWLATLEEAAYVAKYVLYMYEYVLYMYKYQRHRLKAAQVSSASAPTILGVLKKKILGVLKKKEEARDVAAPPFSIKKSMDKLIKFAAEIDQFTPLLAVLPNLDHVNEQQGRQRASVSSPSSSLSLVIGRGCQSADSVINKLVSAAAEMPVTIAERRIPVLAIYGGAGKTALAQSIYKDPRVANHFETKMWVHVSRKFKFDGHTVTEKIIESIKRGECPRMKNFDALQSILKDMLRSKRFFLVLDDVWCLDKVLWNQMLIPLHEVGDLGSRILITCRSEEVARFAAS